MRGGNLPVSWFVAFAILAPVAGPVRSATNQTIRIKVVNGRTGRAVGSDTCLNISIGEWHGADLLAPTDESGVVVLHLDDGRLSAIVPPGTKCVGGFATDAVLPQGEDRITPASGGNDCQPFRKHHRYLPPSYSIHEILTRGVVAKNVCGKTVIEAKPGELIFFIKPPGFFQRMTE